MLFDFRYFTDTAAAEARVESSRHLQSLEDEMREVGPHRLFHFLDLCLLIHISTILVLAGLWCISCKAVGSVYRHSAITAANVGSAQQLTTGNTNKDFILLWQIMHCKGPCIVAP